MATDIKTATSKDVAKLAGVSQSTVSRVFNKKSQCNVSETVRQKVIDVANEIGYVPNIIARGLVSKRTNMIAVVIVEGMGPFYLKMIHNLIQKLQEQGCQPIFFNLLKSQDMEDIIYKLLQYQVDAVIIAPSLLSVELGMRCIEKNIVTMLLNMHDENNQISSIYVDHYKGGNLVGEYFKKKQYENIVYIGYKKAATSITQRKKGFLEGIGEHAKDIETHLCDYLYEDGYNLGLKLIKSNKKLDAIFCMSDLVAIGIIDAIHHNSNLKVPQDIDIVGFDNIEQSAWKSYEFTTIDQPLDKLVSRAINVVLELIENKEEIIISKIKPTLIVRENRII